MKYSRTAYGFHTTNDASGTFAGGAPYLQPDETEYPKATDGTPYQLLFQIDLSTVPVKQIDELKFLPESGYLQFFVPHDDDLFGMSFDNVEQSSGMVRHIPSDAIDPVATIPPNSVGDTPLRFPNVRTFYTGNIITVNPDPSDEIYGEQEDGTESESYPEFYLGGFPAFTQYDFRVGTGYENAKLLLGSQSGNVVEWGDTGDAGFWLPQNSENIAETFLYWDCY